MFSVNKLDFNLLGDRLMVGLQNLDLPIGVRVPVSQLNFSVQKHTNIKPNLFPPRNAFLNKKEYSVNVNEHTSTKKIDSFICLCYKNIIKFHYD